MKQKRVISLLMAVFMAASLMSGCGVQDLVDAVQAQQGKSVAADNWINSEIAGAISEDTAVNLKDDFFTAVNKDWILAQNLPDETSYEIELFNTRSLVNANKRLLLSGENSGDYLNNTGVGMDSEEIENVGRIVSVFTSAVRDTEARDAAGTAPLEPYIEAIRSISTIDEMTDYILDFDGFNLVGAPFVELSLGQTAGDRQNNLLIVRPIDYSNLSLKDGMSYESVSDKSVLHEEVFSQVCSCVLSEMGYGPGEIKRLLRDNYKFEARLSYGTLDIDPMKDNFAKFSVGDISLEEIQEKVGSYPLLGVAKAYGYEKSERVVMFDEYYMGRLSRLYSKRHLNEIKAFYITHTAYECATLLDSETGRKANELLGLISSPEEVEELGEGDRELDTFMFQYVKPYISAPFEMLYIASYCSGEEKTAVREMLGDIREQMANMVKSQEWLTEEGKTNCLEKLDYMAECVLYPDNYISYKGLKLSEDMSLPDMLRAIRINEKRKFAYKVNTPADHAEWDLSVLPTTTVNAVNNIENNSICIFAGILSNGFVFDPDSPYEVNLARLGTILGHEITHSFDNVGCRYDKYGSNSDILSKDERQYFTKKVYGITTYYQAMTPIKGEGTYNAPCAGEAIADMGGVKVALMVADRQKDFDYDLFFRSYAEMWRKVNSLEIERAYAAGDAHPLAYLRTNVTLSQYDKFAETYDLHEGDGMYVPEEDRIAVW